MRIGVFGGTFDPIHFGHLVLAEQCHEQCELDEVWFVPASRPPHKQGVFVSDAKHRCEMVELAIAGRSCFKISRIEIDRDGPSFTVETLEQIRSANHSAELFLLVGADSLRDMPYWRSPQRILELANIIAVNRGDTTADDFQKMVAAFGSQGLSRIKTIQMPGITISASDLRQRISHGRSIRYLLPRAVEAYIAQHRLYGSNNTPS